VTNQENADATRRRALETLLILKDEKITEYLIDLLEIPNETLRYDIIKALNKSRKKAPLLKLNRLKEQLRLEMERHFQTETLSEIFLEYSERKANQTQMTEAFGNALKSIQRENYESIFRLLSLYYAPDIIEIIHNRLSDTDEFIRANAAELLDNLVDRKIEKELIPILEKDLKGIRTKEKGYFLRRGKGEAEEVYSKILGATDVWLKLLVIFMVIHYQLEEQYGSLEALKKDSTPAIRKAAGIALEKVAVERPR